MKKFIFKEIILISKKDRKARRVEFDPQRTIIVGGNSTGKSHLVKSIFRTFGAEPHKIHPDWEAANVVSLVKFSIDEIDYYMMRTNSAFALFDFESNLHRKFTKVSELGIELAALLDFRLLLTNREGETITPPPAYLFLPYYADQDKSWTANWQSFLKLYLPSTRTDVANYHTGIRPNDYYVSKSELKLVNENISTLNKELDVVKLMLKNLKTKLSTADFIINIDDFQNEIRQLLTACEKLKLNQNKLKNELSLLYSTKVSLESQLEITRSALAETNKDYLFAVNDLDSIVPCPSCGAEYENSFAERFGLANDENRCQDLIIELDAELLRLEQKIARVNEKFLMNTKEIIEIEEILQEKKEKVRLKDIIENEGKREVKKLFEAEIKDYNDQMIDKLSLKQELEGRLKDLEDKKRTAEIQNLYRNLMKQYLTEVNVQSLPIDSYKRIDCSIKESGSVMPRALMAYYYSILTVIKKYGSSAYCPIVIDAPNQQGQDAENLPLLLKFIAARQPEGSQLILTVESTHDIKFDGEYIYLDSYRSLMLESEFEECSSFVDPFLNKLYS